MVKLAMHVETSILFGITVLDATDLPPLVPPPCKVGGDALVIVYLFVNNYQQYDARSKNKERYGMLPRGAATGRHAKLSRMSLP